LHLLFFHLKKERLKKMLAFQKESQNYALNHINEDKYKWITTKQPTDFNFDSYLAVIWQGDKMLIKEKNDNFSILSCYLDIDGKIFNYFPMIPVLKCTKSIIIHATIQFKNVAILDMELESKQVFFFINLSF